jgi:hypothetical protein
MCRLGDLKCVGWGSHEYTLAVNVASQEVDTCVAQLTIMAPRIEPTFMVLNIPAVWAVF